MPVDDAVKGQEMTFEPGAPMVAQVDFMMDGPPKSDGAPIDDEQTPVGLPFKVIDGGMVEYGGKQFTVDEFTKVLESGANFEEKNRVAEQRFMEAAEIRKGSEAQLAEFNSLKATLAKLSPEQAEAFFSTVQQIEAGQYNPQAPVVQLDKPLFSVPEGHVPEIRFEDMSSETQDVVAAIMPVIALIPQLRAEIAQLKGAIPEIQGYVQASVQDRLISSVIGTITAETGLAATAADVRNAMRTTGLSDPKQAFLLANHSRVVDAAVARATGQGQNHPIDTPTGAGRTFDPTGLTADQIFRNMNAGMIPNS